MPTVVLERRFKPGDAAPESGVYRVGPLGRLNASEGLATPLADAEYKRMYETLGGKPVQSNTCKHIQRGSYTLTGQTLSFY